MPDEIWTAVLSVYDGVWGDGPYGGIERKKLALTSRFFAREWRMHADSRPPPPAAGVLPLPEAEEWDDYMCCECGRWWPCFVPLDEALLDPWGYALKQSTVRTARDWLARADPAWDWHPAQEDTRTDMEAVVEQGWGVRVWGLLGRMATAR